MRRVLITGASSGIGAEAAELFARRGCDVALVARGEGLAEAGRRARRHGVEAHEVHVDLGARGETGRAMAGAIEALGGLDVAVLNAATSTFGPFRRTDPADFDRVVRVTFTGVVDCVREVLPALERSGGTIVITCSVLGITPAPLMSSYVAAKHALRGFAASLRMELAAEGSKVRVALVHPGPVDTPFWTHMRTTPGQGTTGVPGAYSAETVARAIVAQAERPRRELTVGAAMSVWRAAYAIGKPLIEPLMARAARELIGPGAQPRRDGLHEPAGDGKTGGDLDGRPSLWAELNAAPGRLLRLARR